ncbi:uncharacterized protein NFIA_094470 [Aspergillus fischeri NRRL 181]|uniref:Uncharacterized protein n=1 Tax=Neosartorya fischeri (strain ATCC 1020 / DSM 3700 / CBS 544.65 / FGSC A1164 / JCM 1740 / NRRL 181 / WB 181) TaxID=331117 RepID=A1DAD7_NEOFI|nr:conserved hypothetical protein [Aspergillus fischeri NRRL 181]EAW19827.1 conserved hypothetical protein [Aspergillus fischeri NRRL 181]
MEVNSTVALRRLSLSTVSSRSYQAPEYPENDLSGDSATSHNEEPPAYSRASPATQVPGRGYSTRLHRSPGVLLPTLLYAALAIYTWVAIVHLSFRPMSAKSWGALLRAHYSYSESLDYVPNEGIYRSAVVIRILIVIITLPWLSAVCASAAVIYVQNQKTADSLRMRQVTNLADRRWLDISLYKGLVFGGWKKHGSAFLIFAIVLHLIAGLTYPIQSIFLETKTIRVPESMDKVATIADLPSLRYRDTATSLIGNDILTARRALSDANSVNVQPFLWQNTSGVQLHTLSDILSLNDSFYAQLPTGFNTGVLQQFAPRVNSTATYETILASEFPSNCDSIPGSFYSRYYSEYAVSEYHRSWGVTACMPSNLTKSQWQKTRDRQEFSETLYLNFTSTNGHSGDTPADGKLYRITVNTTAGYFELPNYMNEGKPGPLLEQDPVSLCGADCHYQTFDPHPSINRIRRDNITTTDTLDAVSWGPLATASKGPLLTTALAMFGPGSFLDTFAAKIWAINDSFNRANVTGDICLDGPPLLDLILYESYSPKHYCLDAPLGTRYVGSYADTLIHQWLGYFLDAEDRFPMLFTAAAFLSNKQLLESVTGQWRIHQDLGAEMTIPTISPAGIIVGSIMMALYIIPMLGLAFYAACYPRWTERLDSFTMLRFGAAIGDKLLPLRVAKSVDEIPVLDEIPGVVRDVSIPDGDEVLPVGTLGLGDGQPLQGQRRYEAFKESDELLTQVEHRTLQSRINVDP